MFVVRDLTTEEIDRKIAEQVVRQASQRLGSDARRSVRGIRDINGIIWKHILVHIANIITNIYIYICMYYISVYNLSLSLSICICIDIYYITYLLYIAY